MPPNNMSWLSPKRRRTTGNLKAVVNGQTNVEVQRPTTPSGERALSTGADRPTSSSNGHLFYAYARRTDNDSSSRYLLTFASAAAAQEWWELVQDSFPDAERAGPQLFSFKGEDFLDRVWKHKSFEHLKTKWMYISFGDADSVGGAAQGIIPVQDAQGHLLGGSSPPVPERTSSKGKVTRFETSTLDSNIEKLIQAVERNTEQIAVISEKRLDKDNKESKQGGHFDITELSGHLGRINDFMEQSVAHIRSLAKKQFENEERLMTIIRDIESSKRADYLDMKQLSAHLDRIQNMMELSGKEAAGIVISPPKSADEVAKLNFSPMIGLLEKIQNTIQQQSSHMEALVGFATADSGASGTGELSSELATLIVSLNDIKSAIEANASQVKAFTWAQSEGKESASTDLSSLTGQFASIRTAMEGNTSQVKALVQALSADEDGEKFGAGASAQLNLSPLTTHLEHIQSVIEQNNEHVQSLIEVHREQGSTARGAPSPSNMTSLTDHLNRIQSLMEKQQAESRRSSSPGGGDPKFVLSALTSHLARIQSMTESNATAVKTLRDTHSASADKMNNALSQTSEVLQALAQRTLASEERAQEIGRQNAMQTKENEGRMLEAIRQNAAQIRDLMGGQDATVSVMREIAKSIAAQHPASCGHVVVPPPRKTGRKVVGYVYAAESASREGVGRAK